MLMSLMYCRFSNICYLKAEYIQAQAINYYTILAAQIKGAEGYTDETPVVYINEFKKVDRTVTDVPQFNEINIIPYKNSNLINDYNWRATMRFWCGFDPVVLDSSSYETLPEIMAMPCYPDDGSIKVLEGVAVIKFGE